MTNGPRMQRLRAMAALVLDARSAALREAATRRQSLLSQLEGLEAASRGPAEDLSAARAAYAFEQWAASRRSEINLRLATAQADWLSHLDETRRAFGRARVLENMQTALDEAASKGRKDD
jgi:hypothetical protein